MSVWVESATKSQFKVCLRESRTFDGRHSNLVVVGLITFTYFSAHLD